MATKLYHVDSTVPEYRGAESVVISWFYRDRLDPVVSYETAIESFWHAPLENAHALYPIHAVDEMFTFEEAGMLQDYLRSAYGDQSARITDALLPVPQNRMATGAIPVGGPQDFYMLDRTPGYSLPFSVWGYYDLRRHWHEEPASVGEDGLPF